MATAREVLAGHLNVDVSLTNRLKTQLDLARNRLSRFAVSVAAVGIGFDTVASIASRALGVVSAVFTGPAGALQDLSDRTGLSVKLLQTLGEVATEAGSGLEDVQTAAKGMANFLGAAETESGDASNTLAALGVRLEQLKGRSPDEQLLTLANGLASIEHPTERAALAAKVFGRSSQKLLPLLARGSRGIEAFATSLEHAGLIRTPEQIATADRIGEAWDRALRRLRAAGFSALVSVAPLLDSITAAAVGVLEAFNKWVASNPRVAKAAALLLGVAVVATVALAGAVGTLTALAAVGSALATAWTVATAAAGAFTAVIGLLASPLVLAGVLAVAVVGLLAALGGALVAKTDEFAQMTTAISDGFNRAWAFVSDVAGGMFDALAAGDLSLAGRIGMQAVKVAFTFLAGKLVQLWSAALSAILDAIRRHADGIKKAKGLVDVLAPLTGLAPAIANEIAKRIAPPTAKLVAITEKAGHDLAESLLAQADQEAADLDALIAQAKAERLAREEALKAPGVNQDAPDNGGRLDIAQAAKHATERTIGTFSARMAGNLGQVAELALQGWLEAAERKLKNLEAIRDKIGNGRIIQA